MKRIIQLLTLIIIAVFLLNSCGSPETGNSNTTTAGVDPQTAGTGTNSASNIGKVVIIFAHGAPESAPTHMAALKFKELIEKRSGNRMIVDVYPNNTLGTGPEVNRAMRNGIVQVNSGTITSGTSPLLAVLNMPSYFPDDQAAIQKLSSGPLRDIVNSLLDKNDTRLLGVMPDSFRVTSSNRPIWSVDDFKGLKIRCFDDVFLKEYWKALGAQPVTVAFTELYTALQQNIVEAQENPPATIVASNLYEQQKYIILTNHYLHYNAIFMSKKFYEGLPAEYQKIIDEVMPEVMQYSYTYSKQAEKDALKKMEEAGLKIIDLSPETRKLMKDKTDPALEALLRSSVGDEKAEEIMHLARGN